MIGIGIDQSYSGFARAILFETAERDIVCSALDGAGVDRLRDAQHRIHAALDRFHSSEQAIIAIEGYSFGSGQRAHMAGELGAAIRLAISDHGLTPLVVPPTVLKKYVTGKGNAKKDLMLLHCFKNWNVELTNDNEADAYGLARIALGLYDNAVQEKIVTDLHGG